MRLLITLVFTLFGTTLLAQDADESLSSTVLVNTNAPAVITGGIAITIYDETIDGDLGDRDGPTQVFLGVVPIE